MGMDADLIAIGPYHPDVLQFLPYGSDCRGYHTLRPGMLVTTTLFPCPTTDRSHELAEVLGVEPWDFATHHVTDTTIRWDALAAYAEEHGQEPHADALRTLFQHKFAILYRPNA